MDSSDRKIIIHRGAGPAGHYIWSPFVTKLEFRFRYSNLAYECGTKNPLQAPRGKMPFIELIVPGKPIELLPDTALITRAFISQGLLHDLNVNLSKKELGQDLAVRALLEDKLYYYIMYERWVQNFYVTRDFNMSNIPYPMRIMIGYMVYRGIVKKLYDQGTGRFSDEEKKLFSRECWEGLNGLLEDSRKQAGKGKIFWVMGGNEPTEADASVFGNIVSCLVSTGNDETKNMLKAEFPTLIDYATRIHNQYFPDYQIWT